MHPISGKQPLGAILKPEHTSKPVNGANNLTAFAGSSTDELSRSTEHACSPSSAAPEAKKPKPPDACHVDAQALTAAATAEKDVPMVELAAAGEESCSEVAVSQADKPTAREGEREDSAAGIAAVGDAVATGETGEANAASAVAGVTLGGDQAASIDENAVLRSLVDAALPKAPPGTLQQQADSIMMLLRADWNQKGSLDEVQGRVRSTLQFFDHLTNKAMMLNSLKGTLFQALIAQLAREQQRRCIEQEQRRKQEELARARAEAEAAGEEFQPPEADLNAERQLLRSGDAGISAPHKAILEKLSSDETAQMSQEAEVLRKLVRIKVEDDNDLAAARRALAEAGHFFLLLRSEAAGRTLSAEELLKLCEVGDA